MGAAQTGRRADAERNRAAIVDAGLRLLAEDARASVTEIAEAAGVSRVTMYGHFSSRAELVREVFATAMTQAHEVLSEVELSGVPMAALERLVVVSWRIVGPNRLLLAAAREELGEDEVLAHHVDTSKVLAQLVRRGRSEGAFRTDVPTAWLVACAQNILHGAADELRAGRLSERSADRIVWATIRSLFAPPGRAA